MPVPFRDGRRFGTLPNISLLQLRTYDISGKVTVRIDHLGQDSVLLVVARGSAAQRRGAWILSGYSIGGIRNVVTTLDSGNALSLKATSERYFELTNAEPGFTRLAIFALIGGLPSIS